MVVPISSLLDSSLLHLARMNTFRHDDEQRRQWVQDKINKRKSVKQICGEAQISRATLYNWIDEFSTIKPVNSRQSDNQQMVEEPSIHSEAAVVQPAAELPVAVESVQDHSSKIKTLPVHHAATRHRMLLAALDKVDTDKSVARKLAATLVKRFTLSIAQACEIAGIDEATYGYKPRKPEVDDRLVQQSIVQLLATAPATNFDECCQALRQANPGWTRKQIKRVYREGRLYLKRQRSRGKNIPRPFPLQPHRPGACWNVGLLKESNTYLLFILDDADNMLLNTERVNEGLTAEAIIHFLNRALAENGKPRRLRVPEKALLQLREIIAWAFQHKVSVLRLSMGKPENEMEVQGMEDSMREWIEEKRMKV